MRRTVSLGACALLIALGLLWFSGGLDRFVGWAVAQQRAFQDSIALGLRAVRSGDAGAVATLLTACFAYGLAHAAGPGHGKVLIGGYGLGRAVPVPRLALIAVGASFAQAACAIGLVYIGVLVLNLGRQTLLGVTETVMAPLSYGVIALIGLWLVWRGLRRARASEPEDTASKAVCESCGHAHGPTLQQVEDVHGLRDALMLIGGIALRPCTGALFVLILTWQMGIGLIGVFGALAMAAGTALVTIAVGLAATGLRGGLLAGVAGSGRTAQIAAVIEILAGGIVVLVAGQLLLQSV